MSYVPAVFRYMFTNAPLLYARFVASNNNNNEQFDKLMNLTAFFYL